MTSRISNNWTAITVAGILGATLIALACIMASCDKVRELEHTKQLISGVTTQTLNHVDFP